jgi:hypothetical protein
MNIGKVIGFAWFTVTTPSWLPNRLGDALAPIDSFGEKHIPGFTGGVLLAYKAKAKGRLYSISEKKLYDLTKEEQ